MEVLTRACHQCHAQTRGAEVCPACGANLASAYSAYPRSNSNPRGISAYGPLYIVWSVTWGLISLAFLGYSLWKFVERPFATHDAFWYPFFLSVGALQLAEACGLLRNQKWAKSLGFLQGLITTLVLGFLSFELFLWSRSNTMDVRTMALTLALILVELVTAAGLTWMIGRSWLIDRRLKRNGASVRELEQ